MVDTKALCPAPMSPASLASNPQSHTWEPAGVASAAHMTGTGARRPRHRSRAGCYAGAPSPSIGTWTGRITESRGAARRLGRLNLRALRERRREHGARGHREARGASRRVARRAPRGGPDKVSAQSGRAEPLIEGVTAARSARLSERISFEQRFWQSEALAAVRHL